MTPFLTLALLQVGLAAEPPAPTWTDVLDDAAPRTLHAEIGTHASFGSTRYIFADVTAGVPLFSTADRRFTLGVNVGAGLSYMGVPSEQRQALMPRAPWASVWFDLTGPRGLTHHGFGFRGGANPGAWTTSTYFFDHREAASYYVSTFYEGYFPTRHVDVRFRTELGSDQLLLAHASASLVATFKLSDRVGLQAGVRAGLTGTQTALLAARFRPTEGLEIGVGAVFPFYDTISGALPEVPVSPTVQIRLFDPRGPFQHR